MKEYIIPGSKIKSIVDFLTLSKEIFGYPLGKDGNLDDFKAFANANLEVPSIIIWYDASDSHRSLGYDYDRIISSIPYGIERSKDGGKLIGNGIVLFLS